MNPGKILTTLVQVILGLGILLGCLSIGMAILSRFVKRPANLGANNGVLASCPNMPNCVSTQSDDPRHSIEPITYKISTSQAHETILDVVSKMDRSEIIIDSPEYVYAEFRTKGMGYVDDVELYFDSAEKIIHFRSSSRLPYYDFNVNRKRMELIRKTYLIAEADQIKTPKTSE